MRKFFAQPFIISVVVIGLFIFINSQGWLVPVKNVFYSLTSPVQGGIYNLSLKVDGLIDFLGSIRQAGLEKELLERENAELKGELAGLREAARENEFLRRQIGLDLPSGSELVLARVIGRDSSSLGSSILIDKGKKDGVEQGAVVISAGNVLVGQVREPSDLFSEVKLITDLNSRINILLQDSGITGLVKGGQDLNLIVDLLPQREVIEKGESVVTSGLAGIFPAGLFVGQVYKVISSDVRIFQEARIKPAADFNNLERVFVIKKSSGE